MPGNRWPLAGRYDQPSRLAAAVAGRREAVITGPARAGHGGRLPVVIVDDALPPPGERAGPAGGNGCGCSANTRTVIHPQEI